MSYHPAVNNSFPIFKIGRIYGEIILGYSDAKAFIKVLDSMFEI
jgi:hypothetical protein